MFRVGQKVVCVNARGLYGAAPLSRGSVYTIREIITDVMQPERGIGLYLEEVVSGLDPCGLEYGYYSDRFRPAVERKTDISIFTKMLAPKTRRVQERA